MDVLDDLTHAENKWHGSARTILQGLILIGVLYIASSVQQQGTAIVRLQTQMEILQQSSAQSNTVLPAVAAQISTLAVRVDDNTRRLGDLERVGGRLH